MRSLTIVLCLAVCACGGTTAPKPIDTTHATKPIDPSVMIRVRNQLDGSTAMGRASWAVFALIYSPEPNQRGVASMGGTNVNGSTCAGFGADSIGQRQVIILGVADTVNPTAQTAAADVAQAWYAGNRTLPQGWAALASDSLDWGVSAQFDAGHGRTRDDPIRWQLAWTSPATLTRTETPNDLLCSA